MTTFTANDEFIALFAFNFLWLGGWIIASIFYQKRHGLPLFPVAPAESSFIRKGISGRSHRDFLTRIGGANNCLMVFVTEQGITVAPTFPFNLMFLPQVYDLQHHIAFSDIVSVNIRQGVLTQVVDITFSIKPGTQRHIELRLRNGDALVAALRSGAATL